MPLLVQTEEALSNQQSHTSVIPYVMLIIMTRFDRASHVFQSLQSQLPSVAEAVSDLTRKKADGCLIIDVPLPDLPKVEQLLDTMPSEEVYDYIPVHFEQSTSETVA